MTRILRAGDEKDAKPSRRKKCIDRSGRGPAGLYLKLLWRSLTDEAGGELAAWTDTIVHVNGRRHREEYRRVSDALEAREATIESRR